MLIILATPFVYKILHGQGVTFSFMLLILATPFVYKILHGQGVTV